MNRPNNFHARWLAAIEAWRSGELPEEALPEAFDPGFAVYANTGLQASIAALEANFPSVARWLGEPWFRPLAAHFARLHPPTDERLILYGETFADFLRGCEPDSDWPYLQHLAQLDRMTPAAWRRRGCNWRRPPTGTATARCRSGTCGRPRAPPTSNDLPCPGAAKRC